MNTAASCKLCWGVPQAVHDDGAALRGQQQHKVLWRVDKNASLRTQGRLLSPLCQSPPAAAHVRSRQGASPATVWLLASKFGKEGGLFQEDGEGAQRLGRLSRLPGPIL